MNTRFFSKKQEKQVARLVGGKLQPNSGATPFKKGDVSSSNILVECKTTVKPQKSMTVKKEWLTTIEQEACSMGKDMGVLAISFGDGKNYYVLDEFTFQQMLEVYNGTDTQE